MQISIVKLTDVSRLLASENMENAVEVHWMMKKWVISLHKNARSCG